MKTSFLQTVMMMLSFSVLAIGCSISYSVDKSSDSVSASFDSFSSISDSSGSGEEDVSSSLRRFLDDVRALAHIWSVEDGSADEFEGQLEALALNYGLVDWDDQPRVFVAIGRGLHEAGQDDQAVEDRQFLQSDLMYDRRDLILQGFWGS